MISRTINDEILDIVTYEIKNIAFPSECIITKIYADNHVDIDSSIYGSLTYVKGYGEYDVDEKGILLFLNNELSYPIVIGGADSDIPDLIELITEIKYELRNKVDKIIGKSLSTNDFTDALKTKLDGIESGANKIIVDSSLSNSSTNPLQNKAINSALNNKVDKISGKALSTNDFTDALKTKLDGIEAQANKIIVDSALSSSSTNPVQNKVINTNFANKVDKVSGKGLSTNDFTTALLNKLNAIESEANKTVVDSSLSSTSTNPLQNKAINSALNNKVDKVSGKALSTNDFTDALKTKLDGIATGATKVTVDSALSSTSTNPLQNKAINTALNNKVDKVSGKALSTNDFTDALKTKLDGIATGATKVTVDSALSSTSTNPLQNKAINTALNGKANSSHTHKKSDLIHYDGGGTSGTAGYIKILQIKINSAYSDVPISFDIYQRNSTEPSHVALRFNNANSTDPSVNSFTYTGNQRNIYIYKETTSTWSIIVQKAENYDTVHVNNVDTGHSLMDSKVTFTGLNTQIDTLPTSNITQATFIGFTSAEKTKLSGIATGANKTTVDSALSSTSTNPLQNKAINSALGGKAPTSHAVNANTYGLGTTGVYGHVKTINGLTQSSHSDGLALSAYQGKVLNDNITNASRIRLRFGTSNSTTSYSTAPSNINIVKGNALYVSVVNYAGTAMTGAVLFEINNVLYERTLSNGVASININLNVGSTPIIRANYHKSGEFLASGACKLTVT